METNIKGMSAGQQVNMILEVAEEIRINPKNYRTASGQLGYDALIAEGLRFIHDTFTEEENRESLAANL